MEKINSHPPPIEIDPSGAGPDGLYTWIGFDKRGPKHIFYGGRIVDKIGPMPPPEPNSKRYSL